MNSPSLVLEREFEITSFLVNFQKKLGLYHLINILQDAAAIHADNLGYGHKDMKRLKTFWVLARQTLVMNKWPEWHDKLTVRTWVRSGDGAFFHRDFQMFLHGELIGECSTTWVTLDLETRKTVIVDRNKITSLLHDSERLSFNPQKIKPLTDLQELISFKVRNSDIDHNMHVNNTKYAKWILDSIPFDWQQKYTLKGYEINFIAETKLGDLITILKGPKEEVEEGRYLTQFHGYRASDQKIVFVARLNTRDKTEEEKLL